MRKSSRLMAGLVVLGLFAVVGVFTLTSFNTSVAATTAPQGATESRIDAKISPWEETARPKGTIITP